MILAVLAIIMMTRRLVCPRVLELADDAVLFPHGFPRTRITRLPYAEIIRVSFRGDGLYLISAKESFEITASYFRNIENFHTVRDFICSHALIMIPPENEQQPSSQLMWEDFQLPKPILRWKEPDDWPRYRTHLAVTKPIFPRLGKALWFFVRCFGIFFIPWLLLSIFGLTGEHTSFFAALIVGTLLITLIYHWLPTIRPVHSTEISFRDKGITQNFGKQIWDLNYADFGGWNVVEREFEGRVLNILLLQGRSRVFEFALPDTTVRNRLDQLFQDKQIPHSPDLNPSWELCK